MKLSLLLKSVLARNTGWMLLGQGLKLVNLVTLALRFSGATFICVSAR